MLTLFTDGVWQNLLALVDPGCNGTISSVKIFITPDDANAGYFAQGEVFILKQKSCQKSWKITYLKKLWMLETIYLCLCTRAGKSQLF